MTDTHRNQARFSVVCLGIVVLVLGTIVGVYRSRDDFTVKETIFAGTILNAEIITDNCIEIRTEKHVIAIRDAPVIDLQRECYLIRTNKGLFFTWEEHPVMYPVAR